MKHPCEFCEAIILATWFATIAAMIWLGSATGHTFDGVPL